MATRPFTPGPRHRPRKKHHKRDRRARMNGHSVNVLLGLMPSLPRPVLDRLTARMLDRLDEQEA
jgi:hypothetical protein